MTPILVSFHIHHRCCFGWLFDICNNLIKVHHWLWLVYHDKYKLQKCVFYVCMYVFMLKVFDFSWQWNIEFEIESESFLIVFVDVWTILCPCESNTPFLKVSKDDVILLSLCSSSWFFSHSKLNVCYHITEIGAHKLRFHTPKILSKNVTCPVLFSVNLCFEFCILYICKSMAINIFPLPFSLYHQCRHISSLQWILIKYTTGFNTLRPSDAYMRQ